MLFPFLHNRPNGYFISPVTCCAREKGAIIPFSKTAINNRDQPTILIVLLLIQLSNLLSLSKVFCVVAFSKFFAKMSQKAAKVDKTKHGVKVRDSRRTPQQLSPLRLRRWILKKTWMLNRFNMNLQSLLNQPFQRRSSSQDTQHAIVTL